jgi:hypothetical protein
MFYTRDYDNAYIPSMPVAEIMIGRGDRVPTLRRDVLNQLIVTLNGLASVVEISD